MGVAGLNETCEIVVTPHRLWLRTVSSVPRRAAAERRPPAAGSWPRPLRAVPQTLEPSWVSGRLERRGGVVLTEGVSREFGSGQGLFQFPPEPLDRLFVDRVATLGSAGGRVVARVLPRALGPDVVGDAPAQVVPHRVRHDLDLGPETAGLVLVAAGPEAPLDQHRVALPQAGLGVVGQPAPAGHRIERGVPVHPLPGLLVEHPRRGAHPHVRDVMAVLGYAKAWLHGHEADEGHESTLAHTDPPWVPAAPRRPVPSTVDDPSSPAPARPSACGWPPVAGPTCGQPVAIRNRLPDNARPR